VDVLGADGTVETITGTTIHPVWSVDRQEWVPLAELADGETLQGHDQVQLRATHLLDKRGDLGRVCGYRRSLDAKTVAC